MKKIIISLLALVFVMSGVYAQGPKGAPSNPPISSQEQTDQVGKANQTKPLSASERVKQTMDKIPAEAKLTTEQRDKITAILMQYRSDLEQLKKAEGGDGKSKIDGKLQELRKGVDDKLQAILSAEQYSIVKTAVNKKSK